MLDDIEDILNEAAKSDQNGVDDKITIHNNVKRTRLERPKTASLASFLPEAFNVHVKTWGCAHNSSDSEYMKGILAQNGFNLVDDAESAHLWLLNSCTVKNPAEDHFRNEVDAATSKGKFVVAAGCVSQGQANAKYLKNVSIVGVRQIHRVVEVVEETIKGNHVRLLSGKSDGPVLDMPKVRRNPLIEIIAISTGCLNRCTYCKTKHARGQLGSYPPQDIIARAAKSFEEGVVEIWLTSEDTGAYGRDIGTNLPELLNAIVKVIPEGCRLRLGMTNPPYILDHLDEIADVLNHPRVYKFLHVPVQAGSDAVLCDMKREYTNADFSKVVEVLRSQVDGVQIATDIICGFPTETEEDFEDTMKLCRKFKFPTLFINQFFPRPGTPAAKMKRIPTQEVKRRSRMLSEFFASYSPYEENRIGKRYRVLVTEVAHDEEHFVGHNDCYEQVLVPKIPELMGKLVDVEIVSTCKFSMTGKLVGDEFKSPTGIEPLAQGKVSGVRLPTTNVTINVHRESTLLKVSLAVLIVAGIVRIYQYLLASQSTTLR